MLHHHCDPVEILKDLKRSMQIYIKQLSNNISLSYSCKTTLRHPQVMVRWEKKQAVSGARSEC